jgi:oligoendopeptidase F
MSEQRSSADGIVWNFEGLYSSLDDPAIKTDLDALDEQAKGFEEKYRAIIGPDIEPEQMSNALNEFEDITRRSKRIYYYAELNFAKNCTSHKEGALKQMVAERLIKLNSQLLFFDLAWCSMGDDAATRIINSPAVEKHKHYLEVLRALKPHKMSEPEEKLWEALSLTSRKAFIRLFDETMGRMTFTLTVKGETRELTLDAALMLLRDPDRNVRQNAHAVVSEVLGKNMSLLTFIFNTLVQHHSITDEFRRFPHPMKARNLDNEVDDETVECLLSCVDENIGMVARYYRLKRRILGLDELKDYDRYAPLFQEGVKCTYQEARDKVLEAYNSFSPKAGEIAQKFFDNGWIDAELKQGKEGGAFSAGVTSDHHPYIMLNYTDDLNDAMTMAHELGHGIHQYLAREQGDLLMSTPLVTAETASVFGEILLFNRLVSEEQDPKKRLELLCNKIEDTFATVFRQTMMNRFESRLHEARRTKGELTSEDVNKMWKEVNEWMFGDSMTMTDGYSSWWSYVLHFVHYPFYTYAYSFGELMVLSLYEQYQNVGEPFVDKYLAMLTAGGSDYPRNLMAEMDMDITETVFWQKGCDFIERMIAQAEDEAKKLGY